MKRNIRFFPPRNPLKIFVEESNNTKSSTSNLGVIVAKAGIGKTALIVQLSIDSIMQNKKVLYITCSESVKKVSIRYKEVLNNLVKINKTNQIESIYKSIQSRRFIISAQTNQITSSFIEKKLENLNKIFKPDIIIIDGLSIYNDSTPLKNIKSFLKTNNLNIWITLTLDESQKNENLIKIELDNLNLTFENIIYLNSINDKVYLKHLLFNKNNKETSKFFLDPVTRLIKDS